ncbi:nuclease-related domain-containing protein [Comamonas testosteroni]|uniref:NERD domain protein n=1 Tax=Comamonas testosteroni (strain DSM 14576 / KF-1) TaxID=399795 RepID=B7X3D9_COMTK|nr:nuclease-related domain-containing protein [Comamonas testosteroni]EED70368.1 NERD domain protein [Comamonas testosteroni KF-1]WQG68292.1 nuclease-related domain-containing protein [Comamonas testosteroni]
MDQIFSVAFQGLFVYLGLALAFVVLAGLLRSPRFKGWRGERAVQGAIRRQLNPLIYVDMHNVTLPTADGGSTQIDHLIFSPYGLFVLETKNYQGWIFGTEKQREWTQQIFRKRSRFQNPLRQNYKHVKTLQSLLDIAPEHLHSVIAFVGDCEFKTEMPAHVTRGLGFVGHIQSFTQPVWSPEQMQALLDKLDALRLQPGRATDRRHVAHVRQLQAASKARKPRREPVAEAAAQLVKPPAPETVDILPEPVIPVPRAQSAVAASAAVADTAAEVAEPVQPERINDVPVCPQCEWPLRKLLMQRGPLAGQAIWRCTNAAACSFVRGQV